jgi:SAM-dependent methyltransferase
MKRTRTGQAFWDQEYTKGGHLALSLNPSEDLEKFVRWLVREHGREHLNVTTSILDLGCGNGRNIEWLSRSYGVRGTGYDISTEAIKDASRRATQDGLPLTYVSRSIAGPIDLPDESQSLVLDMMSSHFLNKEERSLLITETARVLRPGGFLFYKTFLLDEDRHAARMIAANPGEETQTYIHPKIGVAEYVPREEDIEEAYSPHFIIHKVLKSHRHKGAQAKRRSISVYMEKA